MNITLDDGRTELWQWDTGRKIVVDDKSVSEVHYSKYSSTQAITREVINGKAEIPNFLLQDTHAVTVYAYSGSIENGCTMAEKTFNVVKKPKPANYVETEEDKAILAKLKAEIGDLSELQTEVKDNLVAAINEASSKSISGYGVKYIAEGYIGENNEFICTTSSEEVIRRCSEIDDGCLCAIRIVDEDSYTIAIAEGGLCGDKGMIFSRVHTDDRGNLYTHRCSLNIESDTVSWSTYKYENITNNYYVELDGMYPRYTLSSATPIQDIKTAYVNGKTLFCRCKIGIYTAVLPLFVPAGLTNNFWLFSGSGGINIGGLSFYSQYFTIAVTSNGVMAECERIATKEYVDNKEVVVKSSTAGSTKKFKITVDDTGSLSAVEVTTS